MNFTGIFKFGGFSIYPKTQSHKKGPRVNEAILAPTVYLINAEGEPEGAVPREQALRTARTAGLDLIEVSPQASPPVCRIMSYGKYRFQQNKKTKGQVRKSQQLKQMNFRPTTDTGDYDVKMRKIREFLEERHKIKIVIKFRGRELQHTELGTQLMRRIEGELKECASIEQAAKLEGRQMIMMLSPLSVKGKKEQSDENNA